MEQVKDSDQRVRVPIGFKLIAIVSLLLLVSLGGLTLITTSRFSTDIEQSAKLDTFDRAQLLSQKVETDLNSFISIGRLIAASIDGELVFQGTGNNVTEQLFAQQPDFLGVIIAEGSAGSVTLKREYQSQNRFDSLGIQSHDSEALLKNNATLLTSAFAGVPILGNVSPSFNYPVLALVFPYEMKGANQVSSVIVLTFTMDRILSALKSRELYHNFLVDSSGYLVADADQKLDLARPSLANNPIVKAAMTGQLETLQTQYSDETGQEFLGTYQHFFDTRLSMISTVKTATALAGVYDAQFRNVMITAILLCVAVFFLFFFSRTLTSPIRRLVDGTNKIVSGDYTVQIPPTTRDEIGRLSKAFNRMSEGLAEREKIKTVFGKFVNKDVAEKALKGDLQLGGESRLAAIFFSDIRSFTSISESLTPHEVVEFLNDYMTRMVACVNATNGIVDKFIGDAIMAIWGVPESRGNDTENAVNGALMMRTALAEFNKGRGGERKPTIKIGSGINSGEVIAGQIGSIERMEYTCIGDAVNLASRIESLNKPFRTDILISQHSYELVDGIFNVEPMKKITVKGKAEPQQIYAVLGRKDDATAPKTIQELRAMLGWEAINLDEVDADEHEEKFTVIE